jgi:DNA-binding CsgD family transcriptional regulator
MTQIIFLPDDDSVTFFNSDLSAQELSRAVDSGRWKPPAQHLPAYQRQRFYVLCLRQAVIITTQRLLNAPGTGAPVPGAPAAAVCGPVILSARQRQVLNALVEGQTSSQMAVCLGMSRRTADAHVTALKQRLQAETRSQLVARAAALGLLSEL